MRQLQSVLAEPRNELNALLSQQQRGTSRHGGEEIEQATAEGALLKQEGSEHGTTKGAGIEVVGPTRPTSEERRASEPHPAVRIGLIDWHNPSVNASGAFYTLQGVAVFDGSGNVRLTIGTITNPAELVEGQPEVISEGMQKWSAGVSEGFL